MLTSILLFSLIKARVVLLNFGLVYFRVIQYLFLFLTLIQAGFEDSSILSKKFCQHSILALRTIQ